MAKKRTTDDAMISIPIPKFKTIEEKRKWLVMTGILEEDEKLVKFLRPPKLIFTDANPHDDESLDSADDEKFIKA